MTMFTYYWYFKGLTSREKPEMQAWEANWYKNGPQRRRRRVVLREGAPFTRRKEDGADASTFAEDEGFLSMNPSGPIIGAGDIATAPSGKCNLPQGFQVRHGIGQQTAHHQH